MTIEYKSPEIFYSLACFTYILSGLFCAVIRWFHMCHPYNRQPDFFYPARRQVTFFFFAIVMELPYVFRPSDADTWFFIRTFGIVYYPVCFAMLFHRYFRMGHLNRNWPSRLYFTLPILLLGVLMLVAIFHEGNLLRPYRWAGEVVATCVSLTVSWQFVREGWWLNRKIDEYHTQNYSNESDFPYTFAKKVFYQPIVWFVLMWIIFLTGSRMLKLVIDLAFSVWMIGFLVQILHPNRMIHSREDNENMDRIEEAGMEVARREAEDFESKALGTAPEQDDEAEGGVSRQPSAEEWDAVKDEVLSIVARRYLEPSLKRVDVVRDVVKSTHTLAGAFITQVGFYRLVNAFRLRHFEALMSTSSANLSQDQIAERCGFKNRWALANARKRMADFDYSLVEGYI